MQHEVDHMALATLQGVGVVQRDADRGRDRAGVDQGKPAERDDTEQQLGRVARRRVVEAELGADRGERLLARGRVVPPVGQCRRRSAPRARSAG